MFWYFVVSMIIWAVLVDIARMSRLFGFPLALVTGAPATLIAEGRGSVNMRVCWVVSSGLDSSPARRARDKAGSFV
jgi:hypothetical protein